MKLLNKTNLLLILLAIVMVITPLFIKKDAEFEGADGQAEGVITEINPDYEPWFDAIWEPPSSEIESLLFSLQVAIGAGAIGYIFGMMKEKRKIAVNR
ncbi:energy-coupling factor ABC transporter substrate-binding protein [Tepidimicrobium xylanilyticum]|uniref:Cobalt transport protein CbiN n=1 Tax=Tepidimicrobium xylanilyticum TaxID=1123352 RepID=A0A1H2TK85_9FIRM|nr:energy-coupling factor ABC transporter substrate-binding protein [Tepidimicrobium xylanilyticum]GMG95923.1 cobalt transport protein CbiN [Tepidimicrobium xylanilyticum]SDW44228.1 cobalt/nickel transport protein [Tepidimicrobium xylanilyticum]